VTVIYLDTLFFLNAVMDYLLLLCSARLAGEQLHRPRMALGAAFGGAYAAAAVLPGRQNAGWKRPESWKTGKGRSRS